MLEDTQSQTPIVMRQAALGAPPAGILPVQTLEAACPALVDLVSVRFMEADSPEHPETPPVRERA